MTLRDLYPYWPETHETIVERLRYIKPQLWDAKPAHIDAGSIRQIVIGMARHERFWTEQIILGRDAWDSRGLSKASTDDLISELIAARAVTEHFLHGRTVESLREVRTAPADPISNEIERNVPISWIIWQILEFELASWGQIQMRLKD